MSTPAGWYPDPSVPGRLRWWDGSAWTDHTHGEAPAPPQPAVRDGDVAARAVDNPYAVREHPGTPVPTTGSGRQRQTPDGRPLAALWRRLAARVLDGIVLLLLASIAGRGYLNRLQVIWQDWLAVHGTAPTPAAVNELTSNPDVIGLALRFTSVVLVLSAVYTVPMLRYFGGTLGKLALGIRVRAWDRPGLPTWSESLRRWMLSDLVGHISYIGAIFWLLDALWPLWDRRRQALHDKWPRTVVVRR